MEARSIRISWLAGATAALGLAVLAGPAFAAADDGGTKAFFDVPSPGSAYAAPATADKPAPTANPNARATVDTPSFEQYGSHRRVLQHHGWHAY